MTLETTAIPSQAAGYARNPALTAALAILVIATAVLAGAWFMQLAGGVLRRLQTGRTQAYALGMLAGVLILLGALKVLVP